MIKFFRNKEYIEGEYTRTYTYWVWKRVIVKAPANFDNFTIETAVCCVGSRISFWEYIKSKFKKGD